MSTIDASIPLGIQPYKAPDQLNMLAQIMGIQGVQQQNALASMKMDEYRTGAQEKSRLRDTLRDPNVSPEALRAAGFHTEALDWEEKKAKMGRESAAGDKDRADTENRTVGMYRDASGAIVDVQGAVDFVTHMHSDPRLKDSAIARVPLDQALAQIPKDPAQLGAWKQQFALGATKFVEMNKPTTHFANTGGATQVVQTPGLGGAPQIVGTMPNTQSPDNAATNARLASDAAASRRQADEHFQAGQSAPQYMETDAGLMALPKKLAPGQQPTGTPVMGPGGQPLGKPLKDIPPAVNTAIIQNTQSTNQIDRALKLLSGQNIGDPAKGGQTGDKNATGLKAYLPQNALNYFDPTGVDARAEVADIGSLKIHDRSGAAVTVSESPRLAPFVPLPTDSAEVAQKKLRRLKTELANESNALRLTYSKEQGYKPSPVQPSGNTGGASGDFGGGWKIEKVN